MTTGADTNSDVGPYTITNSAGTLASTNYTFSLVNGTLTVTNALSTNVVTADVEPGAARCDGHVDQHAEHACAEHGSAIRHRRTPDQRAWPMDVLVTLTNGAAAIAISTLPHGYDTIEADFAGTTNLGGATNILGSTNTLSVLINTAPVAGTANYQARYPASSLTIKITDLLTNATDADGDALTLASVSATSTNGATIN